jgi:hypothetical protein
MKPGWGSAFKNENRTEDWHPPYKGKVMLPDGSVHWLDVTPKKTKAGETWLSVKVGKPVQAQGGGMVLDDHNKAKGNGYQPQGGDDDIPF